MEFSSVVLVGAPNVGKSMLFNFLTGRYAVVSNYPGTTIDVSFGKMVFEGVTYEVVDTPGTYSIIPMSDEERVTRELLFNGKPKLVVHVIAAKQLRQLRYTLELLECGLPVIVVLNMMDEADQAGICINALMLAERLGVPVVKTSAVKGWGLGELRITICRHIFKQANRFCFRADLEDTINQVSRILGDVYSLPARIVAILFLQQDEFVLGKISLRQIKEARRFLKERYPQEDLLLLIYMERRMIVDELVSNCLYDGGSINKFNSFLNRLTCEPFTGTFILALVLYFGLYLLVGKFGAGVLVDYLDKDIFEAYLLPIVISGAEIIPSCLQTMLTGEFGIISFGLRYALVIILPIICTFFFMFALIEDSGYLPRLAMLFNNICRWFGLNGRAVIPLSLGFGCGTMAVMVTRTLETRRERILAVFLLALAVPCSAQLGLMISILSKKPMLMMGWVTIVGGTFLLVGFLAAKLLPGKVSHFSLELPPLRLPQIRNVIMKTVSRAAWYMAEVIPVFIGISILLDLVNRYGLFGLMAKKLESLLILLELPSQLTGVFLLGFFRRDYGAAGLYDLVKTNVLDDRQLLMTAVSLTLFLPCVTQFIVMIKEFGVLVSLSILALIIVVLALIVGGVYLGW